MITYTETTLRTAVEKVYLDGKLVGYIRKDNDGFYYEPLGRGARGPSMHNTRLVHRSLEC